MAVGKMAAEGPCLELIGERSAGLDHASGRNAIHARSMNSVEVHGMHMSAAVGEMDPQPVSLGTSERRAGDAAVVGPTSELYPGGNFELVIARGDRPFADTAAIAVDRNSAGVPVGQNSVRVESVFRVIDAANDVVAGLLMTSMRSWRGISARRLRQRHAASDRRDSHPDRSNGSQKPTPVKRLRPPAVRFSFPSGHRNADF